MPRRSSTPRAIAPSSVFEVVNGTIQRTDFTSAEITERHLKSRRNSETPRSRLYLLQSLRPDLVEIFEAYFRINATFFESHVRRRPYQHHSWNRPKSPGPFSVSYPEIVRWIGGETVVAGNSAQSPGEQDQSHRTVDVLFDPNNCPLEGFIYGQHKRVGALLNHAASWNRIHQHSNMDLLSLLDDQVWTKESSVIRKDFHASHAQVSTTNTAGDEALWYPGGSLEILSCSLEVLLCETFRVTNKLPTNIHELNLVLHEIAIAKWEAFADIYSAYLRGSTRQLHKSSGAAGTLLAQQIKVCQEAHDHIIWNMRVEALNSTTRRTQAMADTSRIDNWTRLELNFNTASQPVQFEDRDRSDPSAISTSQPYIVEDANSKQDAEDARQSLNRLAYLGGIFLPFSIIAAIFSMGQDFAAGMPRFYVFWAISLPLSLGVIATIYADTIRRLTPSQLANKRKPVAGGSVQNQDMQYFEVAPGESPPEERPLGWLRAYATIFGYS